MGTPSRNRKARRKRSSRRSTTSAPTSSRGRAIFRGARAEGKGERTVAVKRRFVAAVFVLLSLFAASFVAAPSATAEGGDSTPTNDAVAINTKDGKSVFKLAFSVRKIMGS